MKVMFIGDIVGQSGRTALETHLSSLKAQYPWDLCIANAENAAGGKGLTEIIAHNLLDLGIDILTMGNHTWDNKDIFNFIDASWLVRPLNYPQQTPGRGFTIKKVGNFKVAIVNLSGQVFMGPLDCPFAAMDQLMPQLADSQYIIIDFHAEATSEKLAMAHYLDGKVNAVVGTHTHIQTADESVLPKGTLYITDVGMTGPHESILGMEVKPVLQRFTSKLPQRFKAASGPAILSAVWLDLEAQIIKRILLTPDRK